MQRFIEKKIEIATFLPLFKTIRQPVGNENSYRKASGKCPKVIE
jgi:hypothetical protein